MRRCLVVLAAVATVALGAAPGAAITFGVEVYGALSGYAMDDVNDNLLHPLNVFATTFDNLENGPNVGAVLRARIGPRFLLTGGWERLYAKSSDHTVPLEFDAGASNVPITVAYFFPSASRGRYGIGAGVDVLSIDGGLSGGGISADLSGNTVGAHALGLGEWSWRHGLAVTASLGYRWASADDSKLTFPPSSGIGTLESDIDYSGFLARVGLAYELGMK